MLTLDFFDSFNFCIGIASTGSATEVLIKPLPDTGSGTWMTQKKRDVHLELDPKHNDSLEG